MKSTKGIFVILLVTIGVISRAQGRYQPQPYQAPKPAQQADPSGVMVLLGPSVYYYQGDPNGALDEFLNNRIGYQLNGFIGYKSPNTRGGNALGLFEQPVILPKRYLISSKPIRGLQQMILLSTNILHFTR